MTVRIYEGYSWNACLAGILEEGGSAENCTVENSEVTGSRPDGRHVRYYERRRHRLYRT